jgi:hypothetical protein
MKEVLRSSADDGHGHGHGHVDAARMEEEEEEEQGPNFPVPAFAAASEETTRGITHLFRNVSASPHSSGLLPVSVSISALSLFLSCISQGSCVYNSLEICVFYALHFAPEWR